VGRKVDVDDLITASDVAALLGLAHRQEVSVYRSRYPGFPAPVVDLGPGTPLLWLRPEVEAWARKTGRRHDTGGRPAHVGSSGVAR
jgi:hypothetical protein